MWAGIFVPKPSVPHIVQHRGFTPADAINGQTRSALPTPADGENPSRAPRLSFASWQKRSMIYGTVSAPPTPSCVARCLRKLFKMRCVDFRPCCGSECRIQVREWAVGR
jgi:hypothetical protein